MSSHYHYEYASDRRDHRGDYAGQRHVRTEAATAPAPPPAAVTTAGVTTAAAAPAARKPAPWPAITSMLAIAEA